LEGGARITQRLIDIPRFDLDGSIDLYGSQNSRKDAPYYNPEHDFSTRLSLRAEHVLYRFYKKAVVHSLTAGWGMYDQKYYDEDWVGNIRYEHRYSGSSSVEGGAGIEVGRNVYDGQPEPFFALNFMLHAKF
jgi:biofilm PGA synthesis protein PgaA